MKRTGPTNFQLLRLISELKKKSLDDGSSVWKRIALDLERPSRQRREVNLSRINEFCRDNELVVVPGKVLGSGELDKKIVVAAYSFSQSAKEKIMANGQTLSLDELMKKKIKPSEIRVIG
jgi:large subunit ribosomal protein L18e